jgi:hypothetical protein
MKFSTALVALGVTAVAQLAHAQSFNGGIPAGWTVNGTAGTLGADGVVSLSPAAGSTAYGYVTTAGSTSTAGYGLGQETNGSRLDSNVFSASVGDSLDFFFNYITSDGSGFADYGYANLLNADGTTAAVLFNARTQPSGTIAPGFGLPSPVATLTPSSVPIIPGGPSWSPLGTSSGGCFAAGCGYTGWIQSDYSIAKSGQYILEFGVTNWTDKAFDSGLAFDGITVAGVPIVNVPAVPEPGTYALMGLGLAALAASARRRRKV